MNSQYHKQNRISSALLERFESDSYLDFGHFGRLFVAEPASSSERDAVHETVVDGSTIDVGCQATIFIEAIGLGLPAGLIAVDQLLDCLIVHRHDEPAGHGEAIGLGEPRREYPAVRGARLQAFINQPDLGVISQVCQDEPGYVVPALNPPERKARMAHRLQHECSVGTGWQLCRPGVAVDGA